jgi:heme/copper-type cytochrome/quinol oxidase subunit 3
MTHAHAATGDIHDASGIASGKLAMWWFLASEIVTFGGLIGSFIVFRIANPQWIEDAHHLSVPIASFNTIVLLTSSLTIVLAFAAIDQGDQRTAGKWLLCTVLGGLLFLCVKGLEWYIEISHGRVISTNVFWAFYFTMTGLHGLHVLGGIVINAILWIMAVRGRLQPIAQRIEYAGLYWHFVDVVWIFLFPLLYLG